MARLDAFIELLVKESADELVLEAGAGATLHAHGAAPRALLKQRLSAAQVAGALGEVLPEGVRANGASFAYTSPAGVVQVRCEQGAGGMRIVVTPLLAEAEIERHSADSGPLELAPAYGSGEEFSADEYHADEPEAEATPARGTPVAVRPLQAATPPLSRDPSVAMEQLLELAARRGASDVHLTSGCAPSLRVDGALQPLPGHPELDAGRVREMIWSILPPAAQEEYERAHAVLCSAAGHGVRVRLHVFAEARGPAAALRLLPAQVTPAEALGLPRSLLEACLQARGLVLVAGPAGSGRSTTLAALVELVQRTRDENIITLEEPVEMLHGAGRALVRQREVPLHVKSFAEGLRQAQAGDAGVVLVSELRDAESAALALEACERGQLVLAAISAPTAAAALERLLALFPDNKLHAARTQLAEVLRCAAAQALCARKTGGRIAAVEVVSASAALSGLIREGKTFQIPSLQQAGRAMGLATLNDALVELVRSGLVEPREAWQRSPSRAELKPLLERAGFALQ